MSLTTPNPTNNPLSSLTYYEILGISPAAIAALEQQDTSQFIKRAYRRALLSHHPDKTNSNKSHTTTTSTNHISSQTVAPKFTIDQISTAYAILSNPTQRASYDLTLLSFSSLSHSLSPSSRLQSQFQTGIETVDLDDLAYEELTEGDQEGFAQWYRSCRCGNPRGYRVSEDDLEEAADLGELMVGCVDCSLWLRVQFAAVSGDDDVEGNNVEGRESNLETKAAMLR